MLDLLSAENCMEEDTKLLSQELVKLVTLCVTREHRYLDYYVPSEKEPVSGWRHVIQIISDNIRFNNTQHFYNLGTFIPDLVQCTIFFRGFTDCICSVFGRFTSLFGAFNSKIRLESMSSRLCPFRAYTSADLQSLRVVDCFSLRKRSYCYCFRDGIKYIKECSIYTQSFAG